MSPSKANRPVIYLAGPMFSAGDYSEQLGLARLLDKAGYDTYMPQRDGVETAKVMYCINHPLFTDPTINVHVMQFVREIVFALDVYQVVDRCAAVVLNADGRVPDEGSVSEAALGWGVGTPVVLYKTTPITMLGGYDNPLISGLSSGWGTVTDPKALPAAVKAAIAAGGKRSVPAGSHVAAVAKLGAKVWSIMPEIRAVTARPDPKKLLAGVQDIAKKLGPLVAKAQ